MSGPKPKKAIAKRSAKGIIKALDKSKMFKNDALFYLEIWEERSHNCENCGNPLGNEALTLFFDHLLEKSKYPDLRHEKENIMLVCANCHSQKTNGFPSEKVKQRIHQALLKFNKI